MDKIESPEPEDAQGDRLGAGAVLGPPLPSTPAPAQRWASGWAGWGHCGSQPPSGGPGAAHRPVLTALTTSVLQTVCTARVPPRSGRTR